jgi:hypothetical protein
VRITYMVCCVGFLSRPAFRPSWTRRPAAGAPTLRLPLGADAVASIRQKLKAVAGDVDANEAVAAAMAIDA